MDFNTLVDRTADMIGNRQITTKIVDWANYALKDLAHRVDLDHFYTSSPIAGIDWTNAGDELFALPADNDRLKNLVWRGDVPRILSPLSMQEYYAMVPHVLTTNDKGEPKYYYLPGGNTFGLYPLPRDTSNILRLYFRNPLTMDPGDQIDLPEKYQQDLIWMGFFYGRMYEQDPEAAAAAAIEYNNVIQRVRANEMRNRRLYRGFSSAQDLRTNSPERWR